MAQMIVIASTSSSGNEISFFKPVRPDRCPSLKEGTKIALKLSKHFGEGMNGQDA